MPQGSAAARKTKIAAPTATDNDLSRPPASRSRPTGIATGAASSFTLRVAPIARPTRTARTVVGLARNTNASATAVTANAIAGPSPLSDAVTHRIEPLVVAKAAASNAPPRLPTRRPIAYTATATTTPDATIARRGASSVRNPTRSASHSNGSCSGPWEEKT